jgi:hypothetical protein
MKSRRLMVFLPFGENYIMPRNSNGSVVAPVAEMGLGCVKTRRGASAGEETSVQITAGGQKFASESDFNRLKKNHSRCFSTFWVSTQPRSFAPKQSARFSGACPLLSESDS